jgi:hypothetical protein
MISNYCHFSKRNINSTKIYTFLHINIYFNMINIYIDLLGQFLIISHNKLQKKSFKKLFWGK